MNIEQIVPITNAQGEVVEVSLKSLLLLRGTELQKLMFSLGFETRLQDPDFEQILSRMLERIPERFDKRQGSIIYDALAPVAVELTEALIQRELNRALSYACMSRGKWLDLRVGEHGVTRTMATKCIRYAYFYAQQDRSQYFDDIPIGSRYSIPNDYVNFVVSKKIADGVFEMICEEPGSQGNIHAIGQALLPVEYISGLALVELGEIIAPGEDEENDDMLYERYVRMITRPPFGGNRADYEEYFRLIDGVGPVRLFRAHPEKGHVTACFLDAAFLPPKDELVDRVQTMIDPIVNRGEGIGLAPMAHIVHVVPAEPVKIKIEAKVILIRGFTIGQVKSGIEDAVQNHLLELRENWANYVAKDSAQYIETIVRVAQVEAAILQVTGVADIVDTKINNLGQNLALSDLQVPIFDGVTVHA